MDITVTVVLFVATMVSTLAVHQKIGQCQNHNDGTETCYFYVDDLLTRDDAESYCRDHLSGSLLAIKGPTIQEFIRLELVNVTIYDTTHQPWIGGRRKELGHWRWLDGSDAATGSFSRWESGYPLQNNFVQHTKSASYYWTDVEPAYDRSYLCEMANASPCQSTPEYIATVVDGRCFRAYRTSSTGVGGWYAGRSMCQELGGFLAKVDTDEVFQAVTSMQLSHTDEFLEGLWIGLHRQDWEWEGSSSGSTPFVHTNWAASHPSDSGECTQLTFVCGDICPNQRWKNTECSHLHPSICQLTGAT